MTKRIPAPHRLRSQNTRKKNKHTICGRRTSVKIHLATPRNSRFGHRYNFRQIKNAGFWARARRVHTHGTTGTLRHRHTQRHKDTQTHTYTRTHTQFPKPTIKKPPLKAYRRFLDCFFAPHFGTLFRGAAHLYVPLRKKGIRIKLEISARS